MVQWLGLHAFTAEGLRSTPGRGTKIPQAALIGRKENSLEVSLIEKLECMNMCDASELFKTKTAFKNILL